MDDLYKEGDFHYDYYTGERYLFVKGRKVSEMQFLQDYLRECKKYDLKPKKELKDRLAELTKPKDSYIPFCL